MTTVEVLRAARALIDTPEKWTQYTYARDVNGADCDERDDEAVRRTESELGTTVPLVSVTKETLRTRLEPLVASAPERRRIGEASRAYVEQVHDIERVADRLLALYSRLR